MTMERAAIAADVDELLDNITPSLSAAMFLESLSFVPPGSLDGVSMCYDAIVAAGATLLDLDVAELMPGRSSAGLFSPDGKEKKPTKWSS